MCIFGIGTNCPELNTHKNTACKWTTQAVFLYTLTDKEVIGYTQFKTEQEVK